MPTGDGNLGEGDKSGTRVVKRDNPMFFVQANNAFRLKQCWLIDLDYQYTSPYDYVMYRFTKPTHSLNLAVSKSFLKHDALNVRLSWNDILNKTKNRIDTDYGNFYNSQSNDSVNSWDYHKDCKTHGKGEIVLSLDEYWQDFRPLTHTDNVPRSLFLRSI